MRGRRSWHPAKRTTMHDRSNPQGRATPARRARSRRVAVVAVLALAAPLVLSACRTADAANKAEAPRRGGTLTVILSRGGITHLDPQQISAATDENVTRVMIRTLTTFKSAPGTQGSEIVADLATDTGRPSQNNTVWEFTLKPKLKWEDGSPITCQQVKYGTERSFSSLLTDGLKYPLQYLAGGESYKGPFFGGAQDNSLDSIKCVDERTIRFTLKQPVGDFGYVVSTPTFAPVPQEKDSDHLGYDKHPFSDGPYKIAPNGVKVNSSDGTIDSVSFVRNNFWLQETDQVRHQYPDKINVVFKDNASQVTYDLIQSQGDNQYAINLDSDVAPNFLQQVINDPDLSKRTVAGSFGGVRYFAINTHRIKSLSCRQGLVRAFNKRKYIRAMGGSTFGDVATTMIPPQLAAYQDFDQYDSKQFPEGDPARAGDLLKKGDCPTVLRVAYPKGPVRPFVSTLIEAYQRVGIEVKLVPLNSQTYWTTGIGDKNNKFDLMYAGWIPDFPNGSAIIPPLFDGRQIPKGDSGNLNYSLLNDPDINKMIDDASAEADLNRQYKLWGAIDEKIADQAVTIPVMYMKALRLSGTKVRGAFIHTAFGQPDIVSLGLAP
jgi:peptide/nickel transport system substrate-binding protein